MQGKSSDDVCRLCCFTYCYRLVFSLFLTIFTPSFSLALFDCRSWCFLTILNLGMLFYVFLFAALQDNHHQSAWGQSFAIWLVLEIIFVSSVLCFLFHILIPSFLFRNVYQVKRKLVESITKYQESLGSSGSAMSADKEGKENEREQETDDEEEEEDGDLSKAAKKTKSTAVSSTLLSVSPLREEVLPFNAAKYLFLSYRLASLYSETKVGKILLSFSSPWPRQSYYYVNDISKKYNKRFSAFIRSGTLVLVFLLTNFLTIPLSFQDLLLSFVTTTGIGYYLYLHLLLYDIHPSLIVLPDLLLLFVVFLLFKVFVYFVLPSEKEKELVKHLAATTTTTSSSSSITTLASSRRFSALHSLRSTSDHYLERNGRESHKRRRISSAFSLKSSVVQPVDDKEQQQQQQLQQQKHISRRLSIQKGIVLLTDMEKAAVATEKVEEEKAEKKEPYILDAVLEDSTKEDMIITSELVEQQLTEVTAKTSSFLSVFAIRNESDQVTKEEKQSDPLCTNGLTNICKSDKRSSAVKVNLIREMSKKRVNSWFDVVGLNVSAEQPTPVAVKESKKSDASESKERMKMVDAGSAVKENLVIAIPEKKLEEKQGGKSRDELKRADKKEIKAKSTTQKIPFAEGKEWKILHNDEDEKYQYKQVREKEPHVLMAKASEPTIAESKDSSVKDSMSNLSFNRKQKQEEAKPLVDNIVDDLAVVVSDDVNGYDDDDNEGYHSSVVFSSEHDEVATGEVVTDVEQALWENEERQDDIVYESVDKSNDEEDNNDQFQHVSHQAEKVEEDQKRDDDDDIILEVHHYPSSTEIADLPIHSYNNHENDLDDGSSASPYVVLQNNKLFILPPFPQRASSFQLPRGQSFMTQQSQPFLQQVQQQQQQQQQQHYFQLEQQFQQPSASHIAPAMTVLPRKSIKIRRRATTRKSGKSRLSTLKKSEKLSLESPLNVTASIKEAGGGWDDEDDEDDDGSPNFGGFDDGEANDLSFILDSSSDDLKECGDM
jgi:hypothetical protein